MKEEISAAVTFLTRLVGKNEELDADQVEVFKKSLGSILTEKFKGHWFPEKPCKGQAYRCIRVNGRERRDPVLEKAAAMCGLKYENLRLPVELTVWVDPQEVCCRFGEDDGSYCTVASFKDDKENVPDSVINELSSQITDSLKNSENLKRQKKNRKPLEKHQSQQQKKNITPRNFPTQQSSVKGLYPKTSSVHPNFFDWNPTGFPNFPSRGFSSPNTIVYHPKKHFRPVYPNDRFHWARK